jgi:glycosyltransferase 2 family protein
MSRMRWFIAIVSLLAAMGVAGYVIAAHWPEGGAKLGLPWRTHALLLGAVAIELVFRGLKIALAARSCGIPLGAGTAVRATLCGDFLDAIAPARVGAEPARFLVLREAGISIASALVVLFLELLLELLALVVIAAVLFVVLPWSAALGALAGMVGAYAAFVVGIAAIAFVGARRRPVDAEPGQPRGSAWRQRMWIRARHAAEHIRSGMEAVRHARLAVLATALACSILHVLMRLTILPIILYSTGAAVPLAPIVLWPLVLLYAGALAPAPSGGGVMEFSFHAALGNTIPESFVGTALIWWRLYSFFIYVALGALAAGRTALRALGHLRDS